MTREEVAEIIMYCKEHKVTYKSRLAELNIPVWRFYDSNVPDTRRMEYWQYHATELYPIILEFRNSAAVLVDLFRKYFNRLCLMILIFPYILHVTF